jgi:hypothetical protein
VKEQGVARGMVAGAAGAAVWAGVEPLLARTLRSPYTDIRFLGRLLPTGRAWPAAGLAWHVANGAAFGAVFARMGGRGWKQGLLAAQAENALTLPLLPVASRRHRDYRSLRWRSPTGRRILAQETSVHALFGVVLGGLTSRPRPAEPAPTGRAG